MSDTMSWLRSSGLGNIEIDTNHNYKDEVKDPPKYGFRALCTSYSCTNKVEHGYVVIDVPKKFIDCPKCGSVLFWERYIVV